MGLLGVYSPTHIAVEFLAVEFPASAQAQVDEAYPSYLNGTTQLRNVEQHQIGYRLGKSLGLSKIHAIDWNGNPPGIIEEYDWVSFGQENGMEEQIATLSD